MKRKVIYIILGIAAALAAVLMFLSLNNSDDARPQLDTIFSNNLQLVELSELAAKDASIYGFQVTAAQLAATTASDNQNLSAYYQERYGRDPKEIKPAKGTGPVAELEAAEAGAEFDAVYKEEAISILEANLVSARALYETSGREDLRKMLSDMFTSQATALERLKAQ